MTTGSENLNTGLDNYPDYYPEAAEMMNTMQGTTRIPMMKRDDLAHLKGN